jgi:hypothetical protein
MNKCKILKNKNKYPRRYRKEMNFNDYLESFLKDLNIYLIK